MKKYLYFWIEKYRNLDDFGESKGYLFENFGVNLSSQYILHHEWKSEKLKIFFDSENGWNKSQLEYFYSDNIVDIKAFVGNNGCGKTTLLTSLFQLVAEGISDPPSGMEKYALIYTENGKFYIKTSLEENNLNLPNNFKIAPEGISSKSNYAIYYSTAFDDQEYTIDYMSYEGNFAGTSNISTNALLINDEESFKNKSLSNEGDYPDQLDAIHCYYSMEQQRRTDFLCDFIDVEKFWSDLNLPKKIQLTVINENIQNAFYELLHHQMSFLSMQEFVIANNLEETSWGKEIKFPQDGRLNDLKKDVIKQYTSFYDSLKLTDQFRFAAMMSFYRAWKDKDVFNLYVFCLKNIKKHYMQDKMDFDSFFETEIFTNESIYDETILQLCLNQLKSSIGKIDSILKIVDGFIEKKHSGFASYKNGFINNAKVYFDLNKHKKEFVKAVQIYNSITKTSPFLFFGFGRALSSGESSMLKLYSRLYYALKNQQDGWNCEEIHFFLDEIDLYLHPEWQRQWLQRFIDGLKYIGKALDRNLKFQVFLTTHSPFMLTDFLTDNVVLLKRESPSTKTIVKKYQGENIFGANIYSLIHSGFFVGNSVGCLFESKIKSLLSQARDGSLKELKKNWVYSQIGDPIIKGLVKDSISWGGENDSSKN